MTTPGDPSEQPTQYGAPASGAYEPPPIEQSQGQPWYQQPQGYTPPSGYPPPNYPSPGYTPQGGYAPPSYPGQQGYPPPPQYGAAPGSGYPQPSPYGSAPGYPGYAGGYRQQSETNQLATASLVTSGLGIPLSFCYIGVLGSIAGIVLGFVALNQIKQTNQQGRGLAIAGIAVGGGWLALCIIGVIILVIVGASMPTV